jgi:hypothetical protein
MVTDLTEYDEMKNSFSKAGFGESDCQFLYADNSHANQFDAYTAINRFIGEAKGRYIIICHQDILVEHDNRDVLENRIREISEIDPEWGLLGNAGASNLYAVSMVITENGSLIRKGVLPSRVSSLDENFLLIKAEANLGVSHDLGGFHLYGTDICLIAECMGRSSYVIDFNITHKSPGRMNQSFYDISAKLQNKYNRFLRGRYIKTTITRFYIGAGPFLSAIMNLGLVKNIVRLFNKLRYNKRVKKAKKYKS